MISDCLLCGTMFHCHNIGFGTENGCADRTSGGNDTRRAFPDDWQRPLIPEEKHLNIVSVRFDVAGDNRMTKKDVESFIKWKRKWRPKC